MKIRYLCLLTAVMFLCSFLFGCRPSNISKDVYDSGIVALEATDLFLAGTIDNDSAYEIVYEQAGIITSVWDVPSSRKRNGNVSVHSYVLNLMGQLLTCRGNLSIYEIQDTRDELAALLGQ